MCALGLTHWQRKHVSCKYRVYVLQQLRTFVCASSTAYAGSGTIFTFDGALDVAMEVPFAADSGVLASMAEYLCTCVCVNRQAMVHAHLYT